MMDNITDTLTEADKLEDAVPELGVEYMRAFRKFGATQRDVFGSRSGASSWHMARTPTVHNWLQGFDDYRSFEEVYRALVGDHILSANKEGYTPQSLRIHHRRAACATVYENNIPA